MSYLSLSGFEVPVAAASATFENTALGERSRSFSGQALPNRRALVRNFSCTTTLQSRADILPLIGLIEGNGHKWSFDNDLYSSKGLGPQAGYTITMSAAGGVAGGGYMQVTSAQTIGWRKVQYGDWSMLVYKYTGGAWHQYVYTYDASTATALQYKDGLPHTPIAGDSILNWFTVTGSADFVFSGKDIDGVNGNSRYDELVIVPWLMTASMVAAFHANTGIGGMPFSELPLLWVTGSIIPDGPVQFVGAPVSGAFQPASVAAGDMLALDFGFTLTEWRGLSL